MSSRAPPSFEDKNIINPVLYLYSSATPMHLPSTATTTTTKSIFVLFRGKSTPFFSIEENYFMTRDYFDIVFFLWAEMKSPVHTPTGNDYSQYTHIYKRLFYQWMM